MGKYNYLLLTTLTSLLLLGCSKQQTNLNQVSTSNEFKLPKIPVMMTDSIEIANYTVQHYWDYYDFSDTTLIHKPGNCEEIFVNFIGLLQKAPANIAASSVKCMMQKAQTDSTVFSHFMTLTERYFYDPTSPTRNDEFYIPALEVIVSSKLIDEPHKIRPLFQLKMAQKNRVGAKASNLKLMLTNGKTQSIYAVKSLFTMLFFYNPGCHTCQETLTKMKESSLINKMTDNNSLKIIAIYTDSDNDEWLKYETNIPEKWINGRFISQQTSETTKYDLKASPTIYLLDSEKKVVLKDAQIELIIDYLGQLK